MGKSTVRMSLQGKLGVTLLVVSVFILLIGMIVEPNISLRNPDVINYPKLIYPSTKWRAYSDFRLQAGDIIEVKAGGKIFWDKTTKRSKVGPVGGKLRAKDLRNPEGFPYPNWPVGCLLMGIEDAIVVWRYMSGSDPDNNRISIPNDGRLFFSLNDDSFADNEGEFKIKVKVIERLSNFPLKERRDLIEIFPTIDDWKPTTLYCPVGSTLKLQGMWIGAGVHKEPEYDDVELRLDYKVGDDGEVYIIKSTDSIYGIKTERRVEKGGLLWLKGFDPNQNNDRLWMISARCYGSAKTEWTSQGVILMVVGILGLFCGFHLLYYAPFRGVGGTQVPEKYGEVYVFPAACVLDTDNIRDLGVGEVDRYKFPDDERTIFRYGGYGGGWKIDIPRKVRKYFIGTNLNGITEIYLRDDYGEFNRKAWMDGSKVREIDISNGEEV